MVAGENHRISSGRFELDCILNGGYAPHSSVLIRGGPGCGKTILGLHFVAAAKTQNQKALIVSFSESEDNLRRYAHRLSIDISTVEFLDLTPSPEHLARAETYEIFSPSEVERGPLSQSIVDAIKRIKPTRVFIDGFSLFRYLHPDVFQYRRQLIALIRFLREEECTALLASEKSEQVTDDELAFASDTVITFEHHGTLYQLQVEKFREGGFVAGYHRYRITNRGIQLLLDPDRFSEQKIYLPTLQSVGHSVLDKVLGGGFCNGSITLISGEECSGKTLVASQLISTMIQCSKRCGMLLLDESVEHFSSRLAQTGMATTLLQDSGFQIEGSAPDDAPELIMRRLQKLAEPRRCEVILIDSLNDFLLRQGAKPTIELWAQVRRYVVKRGIILLTTWQTKHHDGMPPAGVADIHLDIGANQQGPTLTVRRHRFAAVGQQTIQWRLEDDGILFEES